MRLERDLYGGAVIRGCGGRGSMMPALDPAEIEELLARITQAAGELRGVLARERAAMRTLDVDDLDTIMQHKLRTLGSPPAPARTSAPHCAHALACAGPRRHARLVERADGSGALAATGAT